MNPKYDNSMGDSVLDTNEVLSNYTGLSSRSSDEDRDEAARWVLLRVKVVTADTGLTLNETMIWCEENIDSRFGPWPIALTDYFYPKPDLGDE